MKKIINEIFPILISLTTSSQISQLFDLIQELLSNYFVFLNNKQDILNALLGSLRERIFAEMAKIKGTTNITNITINKSWNIIRTLSENKYFLPEYIEIMESHLYPLYEMLKDPTQIDFDEDILLLIATFIKKSKRITSLERGLYKFVGFYFDKYHNVFGNLFDTLNSYVFYGSDFLSNDKQCLDLVFLFFYFLFFLFLFLAINMFFFISRLCI